MPQGESSKAKVHLQILKFLLDGPATFTKIDEACDAARATVVKYLDELVEEGKVKWKSQRKPGKSLYELTSKGKKEATFLLNKQELMAKINQWTPSKIEEFMKFLDWMVGSAEGEEFWLWLPDLEHAQMIKKFKYVETKILRQD